MNDRTKESLSALVDGEADELEVRRLLNQVEDDDELRESWKRYQRIGSLMRDEPTASVDLSKGIMQAIEGEPMDEVPAHRDELVVDLNEKKSGFNWLGSAAVAASVTIAVLLGVRLNNGLQQQELVAEVEKPVEAVQQVAATNEVDPVQLEEAQRKLQQYVLQHAENAALNTGRGMMPFARVASFEDDASQEETDAEIEESKTEQQGTLTEQKATDAQQ